MYDLLNISYKRFKKISGKVFNDNALHFFQSL